MLASARLVPGLRFYFEVLATRTTSISSSRTGSPQTAWRMLQPTGTGAWLLRSCLSI